MKSHKPKGENVDVYILVVVHTTYPNTLHQVTNHANMPKKMKKLS